MVVRTPVKLLPSEIKIILFSTGNMSLPWVNYAKRKTYKVGGILREKFKYPEEMTLQVEAMTC